MTDEYWKKRAKELEQSHHEPAHVSQNKTALDQIPGMPPAVNAPRPHDGEVDMSAVLAARLAQHMQSQGLPGQSVQPQIPQSQQTPVVFVKEGCQSYRRLEAEAYGSTTPLARFVGPVSGVSGRQFEFKGVVNAYVVEGAGPVDMGNINPANMKKLAVIQAPFIGTLLVPESAIFGQGGPKRQVLKG